MNSAFAHPIGGLKLGWSEVQPEASAVAAANESPSPNLNAFTASPGLSRVQWNVSDRSCRAHSTLVNGLELVGAVVAQGQVAAGTDAHPPQWPNVRHLTSPIQGSASKDVFKLRQSWLLLQLLNENTYQRNPLCETTCGSPSRALLEELLFPVHC